MAALPVTAATEVSLVGCSLQRPDENFLGVDPLGLLFVAEAFA